MLSSRELADKSNFLCSRFAIDTLSRALFGAKSFRITISTSHLISLAAPFDDPAFRACQEAQRLIVYVPQFGIRRERASDTGELDASGCLRMVVCGKRYRVESLAGADGEEVNRRVVGW